MGGCEAPNVHGELNLRPLEEQYTLSSSALPAF